MGTENAAVCEIHTANFLKAFNAQCEENLLAAIMVWHGGVTEMLTGTRSGRRYRIAGTSRYYQASAAGEAPATRTGALRQSYKFRVIDNVAEVGSDLDYSVSLEKGTSKMRPRPHLMPAYERNEKKIKEELSQSIRGWR